MLFKYLLMCSMNLNFLMSEVYVNVLEIKLLCNLLLGLDLVCGVLLLLSIGFFGVFFSVLGEMLL